MLLTKKDFEIGQEVACKHVGNLSRYNKGYTIGKVTKAGRKLITVAFSEYNSVQFQLEESFERDYLLQKSNYAGDYELFPSLQAYLDYEEKQSKLGEIQTVVAPMSRNVNLTIDQVRRIHAIVFEKE
ncbi:hypothetical protein ABEY43_07055 [Priestia megaterium]